MLARPPPIHFFFDTDPVLSILKPRYNEPQYSEQNPAPILMIY